MSSDTELKPGTPPPQTHVAGVGLLPIYAEGGIGARLMEAMEAYRKDYVFSPDDGWDHDPTEFEKVMLEDFMNGAFNEQVTAILQEAARAAMPPSPPPQDLLEGWTKVPDEIPHALLKSINRNNQVLAYENGRYYNAWFEFEASEGGWFWTDDADTEPNPSHYRMLREVAIATTEGQP